MPAHSIVPLYLPQAIVSAQHMQQMSAFSTLRGGKTSMRSFAKLL